MGDRKQRLRDAAILERAASILPRYRLLLEDATPRVRLEVDADRWQIGPAYQHPGESGPPSMDR